MTVTLADFYTISHPSERVWWWFEMDKQRLASPKRDAMDLMAGKWSADKPVYLRRMQGAKRTPKPGNTMGVPLFSRELFDLLCEASKQQLVFAPCEMRENNGDDIQDSFVVAYDIPRGCGPLDKEGGINLLFNGHWRIDPTLKDAYGESFDVTTWTGLGVFRPARGTTIILHRPVAEAVIARQFLGVEVTPLPEVGRDLRDQRLRDAELMKGRGSEPMGFFFPPPPPQQPSEKP